MLQDYFSSRLAEGVAPARAQAQGYVSRVLGLTIEARGIDVPVGHCCRIDLGGGEFCEAEAIAFDSDKTVLMPLRSVAAIPPRAAIVPLARGERLPAGECLLGRVVDGVGRPIDGGAALASGEQIGLHAPPINPLSRQPISTPLDVGVRSLNAALTVGCGQRVGLFAGSGVGKSVLLGMMARFTEADVVVVALVGERGREVREFVEENLALVGRGKTVVVAAPADETPLMRLRAGMYAARLSEDFSTRGKKTLLLFDSLTRYAQAQREIALAAGEPPASKGYPPSVFAKLPQLVERAGGTVAGGGSVTAFYTVLAEGDDLSDPVADAARAVLDGHVVLSRDLADEGIYPAIDIPASVSRVMNNIVSVEHRRAADTLLQWSARYQQNRDLVSVGAYTAGVDKVTDAALAAQPQIVRFLSQSRDQSVDFSASIEALLRLASPPESEGVASAAPLATEAGELLSMPLAAAGASDVAR